MPQILKCVGVKHKRKLKDHKKEKHLLQLFLGENSQNELLENLG